MGAYENPITVIDTESAKMWQQASANIAQFSINTMNAINARKTKEAKDTYKRKAGTLINRGLTDEQKKLKVKIYYNK